MDSLARRMVRATRNAADGFTPEARAKAKLALLDYLSCVYESLSLPQSLQAIQMASRWQGGRVTVIGTPLSIAAPEAAFVNATLGHGLVREDMHTGSVSHLGVVIFPTLLALSQAQPIRGREFVDAAICGYEIGAAVGKALMDAETVRIFRPTGITGPLGAAVAGARMLGLTEDAATSALSLAANTTVGLNEWPQYGGDEMFFHVGYAARNAVTAVELAQLGAFISETSLDGRAGLFAALRRSERAADVQPFLGDHLEIMDVFHKPAGACNYAQTAIQAALAVATEENFASSDVQGASVGCSAAALNYPGCNASGPFERVLQAKMSIQYCVAATLARGTVEESNFRALEDSEIRRLASVTTLVEDAEFSRAYPGAQGSEVSVILRDGRVLRKRLRNLTPASEAQVRGRFEKAASLVLGREATLFVAAFIDTLDEQEDIGVLGALLAAR
ncbi:MAG: MmgE/PrpD family protein [Acidobacteriota bacterium]